uniref:Ig-like domain-containing protein n=1 Tax=Sphaeramia orbicularis TaxID=375764 RepID=A0A673ANV5_9TELE
AISFMSFRSEPEFELDVELRRTLVVRAGCSIRLFVPIKGRPTPTVTWTKEGGAIPRAVIDSTESFTMLLIPESTRIDAGKYELTLENSSGKKTRPSVPAKILTKPHSLTVDEGGSARFECDVEGEPSPLIVWMHEGTPVGSSARHHIVSTRSSSSLDIVAVEMSDGGSYTLVVENTGGKQEAHFTLTVRKSESKEKICAAHKDNAMVNSWSM